MKPAAGAAGPARRSAATVALATCLFAFWLLNDLHRVLAPWHHGAMAFVLAVRAARAGLAAFALSMGLTMGPCLLQMGVVLASLLATAGATARLSPRAVAGFVLGYTGVYTLAGLTVAWLGNSFAAYAWLLQLISGVILVAVGWRTLAGDRTDPACRGSWSLLLRGMSVRRPLHLGLLFAAYCAGCCSPYLYGAVVAAGAGGRLWLSAATVVAFSLATLTLLFAPAVLSAPWHARLQRLRAPAWLTGATGLTLGLVGMALVFTGLLSG